MKTLAVLLALTSVTLAADPLKPLLGKWTGKHKETYKGTGEIHSSSLTGVRRPDGGVRLTEKTSSGYVFKYTFYKNGKFAEQGIDGDIYIISSYTGTWKVKDGKIAVSGKGTAGKLSGTLGATKTKLVFKGKAGPLAVSINARR